MNVLQLDCLSEMTEGFKAAFVNKNIISQEDYRPQFVYNSRKAKQKVLTSLEKELANCDEFMISVAFVTMSGITPLLQTLHDLAEKGVKGRILTTNYLNFSEPKALTKLLEFPNIELKMYWSQPDSGFHTKGYIFKRNDIYRMIVGSSNLTMNALTKNEEWNTKLVSSENGEYADSILKQFNALWADKNSLTYDKFIDIYKEAYSISREQRKAISESKVVDISAVKFQPNSMQLAFIENLSKIIASGENRALLISATGTGKTYASAFAAQYKEYKKVLFLVHREQIAKQAIKSYKKIFGNTRTYGLLSGSAKEVDRDFIFSTMQTMRKLEIMGQFARNHFDLVIIDEAHRIGENTYQQIIDYFQPQFLLGMTASPDRTDGFDVYNLFNHNIAYEIRLEKALEEDLLCPFHYFGITDLTIDDEVYTGKDTRKFDDLIADKRVDYIIEKINYYGYSGDRVKGLIFCSRREEANKLSELFNQRGYNTISLSGANSQTERENAIERLTNDDIEDKLDYIFTVDIFNEGVDIPEINQVIMLRPTQSAIIFIQQLGRGLRKFQNKEYVVIIDFIGNYQENNFHIPMALSGDRSYNKDNIRRTLAVGNKIISGSSTIHFDEISKKRIYASIDNVKFNVVKLIKENYFKLKHKLGRIPKMMEFEEYGEMDVMCIVNNNSLGSYYNFLVKTEKENYPVRLSEKEANIVEFISKKFMEGKRIHELEMLDILMKYDDRILARTEQNLKLQGIEFKQNTRQHLINIMTNVWFQVGAARDTYKDCVFIELDNNGEDYRISKAFKEMLENENFRNIIKDIVNFGKHRYQKNYADEYMNSGFSLYQKYEYDDVCRILQWNKNEVPLNIGGYKYDSVTNTYPVFVNYEKSDNINDSINYEDLFLNNRQFISFSKGKRTKESEDVQRFINAVDNNTPVELFVRKNKDDKVAKSFYYLGRMQINDAKEMMMKNTGNKVVEFKWDLDVPVREDIYDYITDND